MNEAGYTRALNAKVKALGTYVWKISDRFTAGIPDCWYSGSLGSLWVEYKWEAKFGGVVKPALSPLQLDWLKARSADGAAVAVIVGSPKGGVVIPSEDWAKGVEKPVLLQTKEELARWIHDQCGISNASTCQTILKEYSESSKFDSSISTIPHPRSRRRRNAPSSLTVHGSPAS